MDFVPTVGATSFQMMPHRRSLWARLILALLGVMLLGWVVSLGAVLAWEQHDETRPVGAIVVLGAAQYDGRPSPVLKARLDHAIALWHQGMAPLFIVTGGRGTGDTTTEAAVGQRYAIHRGVPVSAILLET